ncbi:hypothetical protein [Facivitalis istanbulensis]|uniref:hypothetical protein n=1 Tax=Facivitalis istanbulensis TaxID=3075838 RepID=UPI00387AF5CB
MRLFIRTIGIGPRRIAICFANPAYKIDRLIFRERRATMGRRCLARRLPALEQPKTARRNRRHRRPARR